MPKTNLFHILASVLFLVISTPIRVSAEVVCHTDDNGNETCLPTGPGITPLVGVSIGVTAVLILALCIFLVLFIKRNRQRRETFLVEMDQTQIDGPPRTATTYDFPGPFGAKKEKESGKLKEKHRGVLYGAASAPTDSITNKTLYGTSSAPGKAYPSSPTAGTHYSMKKPSAIHPRAYLGSRFN